MDQFYNVNATKGKIETIASEQTLKRVQLYNFDSENGIKHEVQISSDDQNKTYRLIRWIDDSSAEEVVLRIQGVLCSKSLPPIKYPFRIEPRQRNFFRQGVSLSGLGGQLFSKATLAIQEIHQIFSRSFPAGTLEPWTPGTFEGHDAIDMSNRYFTLRTQALTENITSFSSMVDPDGILATAMSHDDKFTHTIENEVDYYEILIDSNQDIRYDHINPIKFRAGDIVEAQMSFVCVGIKQGRFKMLVVLRALAILDTSPIREASISRNRTKNSIVSQVTLKRKVGYSEDEVSETRERISRMKLD